MNASYILRIRDGDTVAALRNFLYAWWSRVELDAMLAPVELPDHQGVAAQVLKNPDELSKVNPFLPVMLANSATMVDGFIKDYSGKHIAVMLRPCELRALFELQKRNRVQFPKLINGDEQKSLVIFGVDCPGTFSFDEYTHRVEEGCDDAEMIQVALSHEGWNHFIPDEVRLACQLCSSPAPLGADVTIGSIGVASQGCLLTIAANEEIAVSLKLGEVADGAASESEMISREVMANKLVGRRNKAWADLINAQAQRLENISGFMALFPRCTLCADCLDACPLYDGELASMLGVKELRQQAHPLLTELVGVSRWLASCSGCGMCQEACEHNVSLTPLVVTLSHRVQHELNYKPGDPNQRLPWNG
jgi:formate dehydrogenase subunit beta